MNNSIIDKYIPKKLNDLIINKNVIEQIKEFINNFKNDGCKSTLLIKGESGVGKTTIISLLLKEYDFTSVIPTIQTPPKKKPKKGKKKNEEDPVKSFYHNYYESLFTPNVVDKYLNNTSKKKIAIVLDNMIDNLSTKNDKVFIKNLIRINDKEKKVPIIITTSSKHNKMITHIEKVIDIVNIYKPTYLNMKKYLENICSKENIKINNEKLKEDIIDYSCSDYRRFFMILSELKITYDTQLITKEKFDEYKKTTSMKTNYGDIYQITNNLFNSYPSMESVNDLYNFEKTLIPLTIHNNYGKYISESMKHLTDEEKLKLINEISNSIAMGDTIESYIFSSQAWNLYPVHSFYTCENISFLLNNVKNKKTININCLFTKDMNRTSFKKNNRKSITKTKSNGMNDMTVDDFINLNQIIRFYIQKEDYLSIKELMEGYKMTIENFNCMVRIDRSKQSKSGLLPHQIKELKKYFPSEKDKKNDEDDE